MLGGLLGVRPGDKLLRYKVMVVMVMAVTIVVVWMGFSECRVNLLTQSLMLGDCSATPMEGDFFGLFHPLQIAAPHPRVEILLERDARERAPPAYGSLFRRC